MSTLLIGGGLAAHLIASQWSEDLGELSWLRPTTDVASEVPGALMHAFPGRSLLPFPENIAAYQTSVATLRSWARALGPDAVRELPIARPVAPGSLGRRYRNTYRRGAPDYPELLQHSTWGAERLRADLPVLSHNYDEAIVYGPSFSVHMPSVLAHMRKDIPSIPDRMRALRASKDGWVVSTDAGDLHAERVILCVGTHLPDMFPDLPLAINGGELLVLRSPGPTLPMIISGGGHIAPGLEDTWVAGSSYLRPEDGYDLSTPPDTWRDDAETVEAIKSLIGRLVPSIHDAEVTHIWRQKRAVYLTDRLPLAGPVPDNPGLFVLGALGSKGLLWGPRLATCIIQSLRHGADAVPDIANARRVRRWNLAPASHP